MKFRVAFSALEVGKGDNKLKFSTNNKTIAVCTFVDDKSGNFDLKYDFCLINSSPPAIFVR